MTAHPTCHLDRRRAGDETLVESRVIPFGVVVLEVLRQGAAEVPPELAGPGILL
jgi:hypothetical protein